MLGSFVYVIVSPQVHLKPNTFTSNRPPPIDLIILVISQHRSTAKMTCTIEIQGDDECDGIVVKGVGTAQEELDSKASHITRPLVWLLTSAENCCEKQINSPVYELKPHIRGKQVVARVFASRLMKSFRWLHGLDLYSDCLCRGSTRLR
jgi:hypothetical protein